MGEPSTFEIILAVIAITITVLGWLAQRRPDIAWLRPFDFRSRLSEEQQRRLRRTSEINVGAQLILMGLAIPAGYLVLKVMFFDEPTPLGLAVVAIGSVICIALGVTAIVKSARE